MKIHTANTRKSRIDMQMLKAVNTSPDPHDNWYVLYTLQTWLSNIPLITKISHSRSNQATQVCMGKLCDIYCDIEDEFLS